MCTVYKSFEVLLSYLHYINLNSQKIEEKLLLTLASTFERFQSVDR
jgi:hypothetical protein